MTVSSCGPPPVTPAGHDVVGVTGDVKLGGLAEAFQYWTPVIVAV